MVRNVSVYGAEYNLSRRIWPAAEIVTERVSNLGSRSMWSTTIRRTNGHIDTMRGITSNPYNATRAIANAQNELFMDDSLGMEV